MTDLTGLVASVTDLTGVHVTGNGYIDERFVPLEDVIRILAEEFVPE